MSEKKAYEFKPEMNVYERIAGVMSTVSYLQKDSDVNGQYKALSIMAFVAAIRRALLDYRLVAIPTKQEAISTHYPNFYKKSGKDVFRTEVNLTIRFVNLDNPSDFVEIETYGAGIDEGDKDTGKALSYAFKTGQMKLFWIETGEGESSPFEPPAEVETLSGEQLTELLALAKKANVSESKLCQSVSIERIEDFPVEKLAGTTAGLTERIARLAEKKQATATRPVA